MSDTITPSPGDSDISLADKFPTLIQKGSRINGEPCGKPITKQCRHRSRREMQKCRDKNRCEFPSCKAMVHAKYNPIDPHHAKTRGSGGDDSEANLVALCREHHELVHRDPEAKAVVDLIVQRRGA